MYIAIGHVRHDHGEYIGRRFKDVAASPLGNPYGLAYGREQCIAQYREWLWSKIKYSDRLVLGELKGLIELAKRPQGVTLVCWCRRSGADGPSCHGDVVRAAMLWMNKTGGR